MINENLTYFWLGFCVFRLFLENPDLSVTELETILNGEDMKPSELLHICTNRQDMIDITQLYKR